MIVAKFILWNILGLIMVTLFANIFIHDNYPKLDKDKYNVPSTTTEEQHVLQE